MTDRELGLPFDDASDSAGSDALARDRAAREYAVDPRVHGDRS